MFILKSLINQTLNASKGSLPKTKNVRCQKSKSKRFALTIGLVAFFIASFVNAASVLKMDLSEITQASDSIVLAKCIAKQTRWQGNKIITENTLLISDAVKGSQSTEIVVTTIGGTAPHQTLKVPVTMTVPGSVNFKVDEEVLIFTAQNRLGQNQLVGMQNGLIPVETDEVSGEKKIAMGYKVLSEQSPTEFDLDDLFSPSLHFDAGTTKIKMRKLKLDELIDKIKKSL